MVVLALLALVASVMVWVAPGSQAQSNQAPIANAGVDVSDNAGTPPTYSPSNADGTTTTVAVGLDGTGSFDVDDGDTSGDCVGCEYKWEMETGPYDWIQITNDDNADTATFNMPTEAFVDNKVSDSDPQKHVINVRLTVTDNRGATDSDTVSININQRPVADIQVFAGLLDRTLLDPDASTKERYNMSAVIDGPGENGNRDNEWDVMEGAYLQLDGSGSTDENPLTGQPASHSWALTLRRGSATDQTDGTGFNDASSGNTGRQLEVGAIDEAIDLNGDGDDTDAGESVKVLPMVDPNRPVTLFYTLTVTDDRGRSGTSIIRIVVNDTSITPDVSIGLGNANAEYPRGAGLSPASLAKEDTRPQSTVSQFTGVENQFIVAAGSTVQLAATVKVNRVTQTAGYSYRWSGAVQVAAADDADTTTINEPAEARIRIPANAEDGDTIDVSVTVTDTARRTSVTTPIQLLVGENTSPTAGGVPANEDDILGTLYVHSITDGFQNQRDGSTVTLRGVGNDADGDSIITAWAQREAPDPDTFNRLVEAWLDAKNADSPDAEAIGAAAGAVLQSGALGDLRESDEPLVELDGALTDTVSFDVPNLKNGENKGTILIFTVIDSNGVSDTQLVYVHIRAEDDKPDAKAGADQQVDPEAFVRLNGSASSDPDVGDEVTYSWEYTGATMDPLPSDRSPLSADEIDELDGWILDKADNGDWKYIVDRNGQLTGASDNLKSTTSPYPYFDAPDLTGFNNLKLTFKLTVTDSFGRDFNGDGDDEDTVDGLNEETLDLDLNGDGDKTDTSVDGVVEGTFGNQDTDTVVITVVNRYFSGQIPGPDFCTNRSLGGARTYAFDSDGDGVADACSLNTTRRATVARQNALETLANLNPVDFRNAVNAECGKPGFKQANYGDDPEDLDADVCETGRVSPPPAAADPATAEVFFSGTVSGPDFCTNHSLGGARTYANDVDGDGVADQCSLATTRREAVARQTALEETFIVTFSADEQTELTGRERLVELSDKGESGDGARSSTAPSGGGDSEVVEYSKLYKSYVDDDAADDFNTDLTAAEKTAAQARIGVLADKKDDAARYTNALAAACRALGSQDFGDAASALARDLCVTDPTTGRPLN